MAFNSIKLGERKCEQVLWNTKWRENQIGEDLGSAMWTFSRHRVKISPHRRLCLSTVQDRTLTPTF